MAPSQKLPLVHTALLTTMDGLNWRVSKTNLPDSELLVTMTEMKKRSDRRRDPAAQKAKAVRFPEDGLAVVHETISMEDLTPKEKRRAFYNGWELRKMEDEALCLVGGRPSQNRRPPRSTGGRRATRNYRIDLPCSYDPQDDLRGLEALTACGKMRRRESIDAALYVVLKEQHQQRHADKTAANATEDAERIANLYKQVCSKSCNQAIKRGILYTHENDEQQQIQKSHSLTRSASSYQSLSAAEAAKKEKVSTKLRNEFKESTKQRSKAPRRGLVRAASWSR